ncbi:probable LRR receptor-like serine/threonine-protein kinase At1g05700 [Cannabis sativa]|uniref:probable LRR receptor-like serine/threonine-protein kinase At1g05700 n=1 Tax=Cannabis sativa TaxID=3483 RepID=UPI0029CA08B5|nr:probable LRR receptor-like serine/threonine-protein kinase At1g05700 [Cannabis sativa]
MRVIMIMYKNFLLASFQCAFILIISLLLVQAQSQSGFISIDCGLSETSGYVDGTTDLTYVSDTNFTEAGENHEVTATHKFLSDERQLWNVRSFPEGARNCYTLKPVNGKGERYLIRARFMYGNYDNKNRIPEFDLYIGVDFWNKVVLKDTTTVKNEEIIHIPVVSDYIHVCLVNTGKGIPFISALELRPLIAADHADIYKAPEGSSLQLHGRYDFSSSPTDDEETYRYKDDPYDRLWQPLGTSKWNPFINTSLTDVNSITKNIYELPFTIMNTAYTAPNNTNMFIQWSDLNITTEYYFFMHFAELKMLQPNETRDFKIYINDALFMEELVPKYLSETTGYPLTGKTPNSEGVIKLWFNRTKDSTLPPLINAVEVYMLMPLSHKETDQTDAEAILNIKSAYEVKKNWQGDPCTPEKFTWDGVKCNSKDDQPRIIYLNLSSSGVKGEIVSSIADLKMLQHLDLSYNNLTGAVPEFLGELSSLVVLNLKGNNLTGPLPAVLSQRSKSGLLLLSIDDTNTNATTSLKPNRKNKKFVIPVVASFGGLIFILLIVAAVIWTLKRRSRQPLGTPINNFAGGSVTTQSVITSSDFTTDSLIDESKKRRFTYSEVIKMTDNFERILGRGGFGTVFHGFIDDGTQVAVKMLSHSSDRGYQQFQAEVKLLMRVHHRNLTTLVGYCNEGSNRAVIYEYMANGSLDSHLSERVGNGNVLSWKERLQIAIDAAQGLEYLHNGCKPPIVHRDVKTSNILISENFQAKMADFGLSKIFPTDDGTHVSTVVAGTPGYLDPEYYITNRLNEKSDVYSFGAVLLEIITSLPIISRAQGNQTHLKEWVSVMVANGDINNIVDPRLRGYFEINSVWKAVEISMACLAHSSNQRPNMNQVVSDLNECLATELAGKNNSHQNNSTESMNEMYSMNVVTPLPR